MSEAWTWTYLDPAGRPMAGEGLTQAPFPAQADAEAWLGDTWQDLAELGVDAVALHRDGTLVYGPMSLSESQ